MHFTSAIALAILSATAEAIKGQNTFAVLQFRDTLLTSGRMDPVVSPGVPSGHSHVIQGGNAFKLDMTDDDPLTSTCTSAKINKDFSNYWTPSLYFKDPNTGKLEDVPIFYQNVYYFFDAAKEEVHPFPKGLRMFVGDPSARTPPKVASSFTDNDRGTIQPIQWTCPRSNNGPPLYPPGSDGLHGVGIQDPGNGGQGVGFPDKECDGYASPLRADIHFPSCYDPSKGVRNYKENMQWPTSGVCPQGTVHVPHLFFEIYWNTLLFKDRWTKGQGESPWVLSNGDPTGYSLHGDFINGWEEETIQAIIDTCNAGSRGMVNCPNIPGGFTDGGSCHISNLVPETLTGTLDKLPGGNKVGQWGVAGSGGGGGGGSVVPAAPSSKPASVSNPTPVMPAASPSVKPATSPVKVSIKASASSAKPTAKPTSKPGSGSGGSSTLLTSYISETTVIWTTVTLPPPSSTGTVGGWSYKGCFSDTYERVLSGIEFANIGNKQVTNTKCVAYCESKGFSIAGTEFGGQCFCGNELKGSSKLAEEKCAMPCEGDGKETCGGGLTLTVYEKKGGKKARRVVHLNRHLNGHSN